jgi:hypothetical protein
MEVSANTFDGGKVFSMRPISKAGKEINRETNVQTTDDICLDKFTQNVAVGD